MAGPALSPSQLVAGELLVRLLDDKGIVPHVAAWVLFNEDSDWKLVLQFDPTREKYPTLLKVVELIASDDRIFEEFWLGSMTIVPADDEVAVAVKQAARTDLSINRLRIGPSFVNGIYIENGLVYRALGPIVAEHKSANSNLVA